jgi:hypothetical protein
MEQLGNLFATNFLSVDKKKLYHDVREIVSYNMDPEKK